MADLGAGIPALGVGNPATGAGIPALGVGNPAPGAGIPALGVGNPAPGAGIPALGVGNLAPRDRKSRTPGPDPDPWRREIPTSGRVGSATPRLLR